MKKLKGWKLFRAAYFVLLAAFTAYVALDAFVIPRAYVVNAGAASSSVSHAVSGSSAQSASSQTQRSASAGASSASSGAPAASPARGGQTPPAGGKSGGPGGRGGAAASSAASSQVSSGTEKESSDGSYSAGGVTISMTTYRVDGTDVYAADVRLASADLLTTAFANNTYGRNIKAETSEMAEENGAILAINGDFYGAQSAGYVIRNGVLYRDKAYSADREDLVIYSDGTFGFVREGETTAQALLDSGARQVFSFGPALVKSGQVSVSGGQEVAQAMTSNPRTAIGVIGELHYVFVVADGRTNASAGLSLSQLAEFMRSELGCTDAYNLDGGGSSTMYFSGSVVNNPTTNGSIKERSVSDIVYIKAQ